MLLAVDIMLGKLARYLRIMGYDTLCSTNCTEKEIVSMSAEEGRILLTRSDETASMCTGSVIINADLIKDQLKIADNALNCSRAQNNWFTRCSICNSMLISVEEQKVKNNVPDYVFIKHTDKIRFCHICNRFYWPGTHREKMRARLKEWGF